ncbi:hypothetical protein HYV74_03600 [Candidatus Uhrbacteria bacterium]|nr:hypothetical protein [Candidatus Uhrbacteria bacterium]
MERPLMRMAQLLCVGIGAIACTPQFSRPGDVLPCGADGSCATGYVCTPVERLGRVCLAPAQRPLFCDIVEQCDGHDNTCDEEVDEGLTRTCTTACGQGTRRCVSGDWGACSARQPLPERCDGIDNDCRNGIDDPWSTLLRQPCIVGRGACARTGVYVCASDQLGVVCGATAGSPGTETCNNVDDNCDGVIDNDLTRGCMSTVGSGMETCRAGEWTNCTAPPPIPEVCDGQDNDGVRGIDDPWAFLLGQPCTAGVGACLRTGTYRCASGGRGVECDVTPGTSATEECNDVDDDCDGLTDEIEDVAPIAIGFDASPCRPRVDVCIDGQMVTIQEARGPGTETCNGVDDDCNGTTDDPWQTGMQALGTSCEVFWDACRGRTNGMYVCASDGSGVVCDAREPSGRRAQAELCNAVDDDCDGVEDGARGAGNTRIPLAQSCYPFPDRATMNVGRCRTGTTTCDAGGWGSCVGAVVPALEACDGADNNCNGRTDELSLEQGAFNAGTSTWTFDDDFERVSLAPWVTTGSVHAVPFLATGFAFTGTSAAVLAAGRTAGVDQRASLAYVISGCASYIDLEFRLSVIAWTEQRARVELRMTGLSGVFALTSGISGAHAVSGGASTPFAHDLTARSVWVPMRVRYDHGDLRLYESGTEVFRVQNVGIVDGVEIAVATCCEDDTAIRVGIDEVRLTVRP